METSFKWEAGMVKVAIRAQHYGPFCVHTSVAGNTYVVTHSPTGFKAHEAESNAECMRVAESLVKLPFWEMVKNGNGTEILGLSPDNVETARAVIAETTAQ